MAAPAVMGGAGGAAAPALLSNIPDKFKPLLSLEVPFFVIKSHEIATNNMGRATYSFRNRGTPQKPECFQKFQNKFLKFDEQIIDAPAGIYTWILKDFEVDRKRHLVFAQTPSKQEVGTLHINLDSLTAGGSVYIAGELQISEDRTYSYNIVSGTYSAKLPAANQEARNIALQTVLVDHGIPKASIIILGYMPILDTTNIRMSANMRKFYNSCGMNREAEEIEELNLPSNNNMGGGARRRRQRCSHKVRTRRARHRHTVKHGR